MGVLGCTCGWAQIRETLAGDALKPTERQQMTAEIERLTKRIDELERERTARS
jgi:hypothetical protein